jgi:hypothetical protein
MGVVCGYVFGVSGHLYVSMDEVGCFEFWSLYVDIDVMWVYVVGAGGRVLSCLGGLFYFIYSFVF